MRKGTTTSGFSYEFDEARLDDMRFVDVMAVVVDETAKEFDQIVAVSRLITMLLGPELKEQLYAHIGKAHDGRVPIKVLKQHLEEIMTTSKTVDELKN